MEHMILDAHTHMGSEKWPGHAPNVESADWAVDYLRQCGIWRCVTTPWQAVLCAEERDLDEGNAEALALHDRYPGFITPGVVIDFRWPERSMYWLETFHTAGFRWVGELVPKAEEGDAPFTNPAWHDLFAFADEKKMVVQLHNTTGTAHVARQFPKLKIVGSHLYPNILPELVDLPNVMVDISGANGGLYMQSLVKAREMFGVERLLYGTDFDGYDPLAFLARCRHAFPEDELELLYFLNYATLFDDAN